MYTLIWILQQKFWICCNRYRRHERHGTQTVSAAIITAEVLAKQVRQL